MAESETQCKLLAQESEQLRQWKRAHTPAAHRKAEEALQPCMKRRRHREAQARLQLALQDPDLSINDIAAALQKQEKVDVLFETRVLWERKMQFAQNLADSMNASFVDSFVAASPASQGSRCRSW